MNESTDSDAGDRPTAAQERETSVRWRWEQEQRDQRERKARTKLKRMLSEAQEAGVPQGVVEAIVRKAWEPKPLK